MDSAVQLDVDVSLRELDQQPDVYLAVLGDGSGAFGDFGDPAKKRIVPPEIMEKPSVKILLFLFEKREVRYADLAELIHSRGTLSLNLKDVDGDGLIQRRVMVAKPIESYYSLTEKGKDVAKHLNGIGEIRS